MVKIITTSHFDHEYVMSAGLYGEVPLYPQVLTPEEREAKQKAKDRIRDTLRRQARKEAKAKKQAGSP